VREKEIVREKMERKEGRMREREGGVYEEERGEGEHQLLS